MKKWVAASMLVISLIVAGCSSSQSSTGSQPAGSETVNKEETKTAANYPEKPIEMIVPLGPGSGTDITARALASVVSKYLPNGQSVVVVNKPGGAGTIAMTEVMKAEPDGYIIGYSPIAPLSIQPHFGNAPYTHDSFQAVMRVTSDPQIMYVRSDAPWKTFEEWLDYVKKNPDQFTFSQTGAGSLGHVTMEAVNAALGIKTKSIPFESSLPINAVLGGHVQATLVNPQNAKTHVDAGKVRPLLNMGTWKSEAVKDVPLLKEKGVDVGIDIFAGIVAPKGLPKEKLDILHQAFKKALEDPELSEQFKKMNIEPVYGGPEEFQQVITDSFNDIGATMKEIGLAK